jgi:hypothetical protein
MLARAHKLVIYAVVAALAVANGFTPRHAQASGNHHALVQPSTAAAVDSETTDASELAGAHRCHDDGGADRSKAYPDSNCCVASCSAAAFIFANFEFNRFLPRETFVLPLAPALTPAALIGDDPPPR